MVSESTHRPSRSPIYRRGGLRATVAVAVLSATMVACGGRTVTEEINDILPEQSKYQSSTSLPALEVPPGLSSSTIKDSFKVPGASSAGSATYSEYSDKQRRPGGQLDESVLPSISDAWVERKDEERWLVVRASPGQLWPRIRDFLVETGFVIELDDPSIGIMETSWAEERPNLPQGFLRRTLAKLNNYAYTYASRDRFRVRLERGETPGTTEIFISHRGAQEVSQAGAFVWQPRPSDPELEAEMLNRLLVSLGVEQRQADTLMAQSRPKASRARLVRDASGGNTLALEDDFSRAWRRTGLALDRVGFTVEDRDRSRGLFFVRYVDPLAEEKAKDESFVSKLKFWSDDKPEQDSEYLISLKQDGPSTDVVVLTKAGEREVSKTADQILSLLHEQLK